MMGDPIIGADRMRALITPDTVAAGTVSVQVHNVGLLTHELPAA